MCIRDSHCGEIEIQVDLKQDINELMRCNCSMCKRKGTMYTIIRKENLKIVKGETKLRLTSSIPRWPSTIFVQSAEPILTT